MNDRDRQILTVLAAARRPLDQFDIAGRLGELPDQTMARLDAMYPQLTHWTSTMPRLWTITPAGRAALAAPPVVDHLARTDWIMGLIFLLALAAIGVLLLVVGE